MLRKSITFPGSTAEKRQCWDSESGHLPLNHPASHIPDPRTSFLFPSTSHIPHQVSSPVYNVPFTLSSAWAIILMSTHAGHFSKHGHAHHLIRLSEVPRCVPVRPSKMNWTADSHSRKKAEFLQLSSKWPVATLNQVFFFFTLCVDYHDNFKKINFPNSIFLHSRPCHLSTHLKKPLYWVIPLPTMVLERLLHKGQSSSSEFRNPPSSDSQHPFQVLSYWWLVLSPSERSRMLRHDFMGLSY